MALNQVSNPFAFLAGAATAAAPARIRPVVEPPKLDIAWGSFHQGIWSSVRALFTRSGVPRKFTIDGFFKECWIERRMPKSAIAAAALWHIFFLIAPYPRFPAAARHYAAFENTELTWSGSVNDLPLLDLKSPKAKPSLRGEPEKPLPPKGADAFHPRQHIFTDPVHPTHPRQTLINSAAPLEAPKILPSLPNIVQMQELAGPARPRLQISKETLEKLHPKTRRAATVTTAPLPDVPSIEQKPGEITLLGSPNAPARPKLELNAGAAPRLAQKAQTGDAGPAPEVGVATNASDSNSPMLIAISATPGPPAPVVQVPQGNLAARVSISPEGKQPGVPGGSPKGIAGANVGTGGGNGSGKNGVDVSISGGNPPANKGISGIGAGRISAPSSRALITRPEPRAPSDDAPEQTGPPNFAALPAGAVPEQIFATKKVYKLLVNMPNLNSATGSWILNFSELRVNAEGPRVSAADLSGPAPVRKVDPKYPPTLRNEHVEGEVVLYAVIRRDGSVDSIQLVHGIDELLDANAMEALSQWKFRPAARQGEPVELEAIVHIPFHAPDIR
ncbi:MAG TPA: TonB family protein [Candidatus Angelobacter sp.]|nr:TonB family protein [Candidatus Angelobacter sp.]